METIILTSIMINNEAFSSRMISFRHAELIIVTQYGDRLWYIDVDGIGDKDLLDWFERNENIRIDLQAVAKNGDTWSGTSYFHPNKPNSAAAIRGDGELILTRD